MKLLIAFIIIFLPLSAEAESMCSSLSVLVQAIGEDRDSGIPIERELLETNIALAKMHMLNRDTKNGMEQAVRTIYSSSATPSELSDLFLENCKEKP